MTCTKAVCYYGNCIDLDAGNGSTCRCWSKWTGEFCNVYVTANVTAPSVGLSLEANAAIVLPVILLLMMVFGYVTLVPKRRYIKNIYDPGTDDMWYVCRHYEDEEAGEVDSSDYDLGMLQVRCKPGEPAEFPGVDRAPNTHTCHRRSLSAGTLTAISSNNLQKSDDKNETASSNADGGLKSIPHVVIPEQKPALQPRTRRVPDRECRNLAGKADEEDHQSVSSGASSKLNITSNDKNTNTGISIENKLSPRVYIDIPAKPKRSNPSKKQKELLNTGIQLRSSSQNQVSESMKTASSAVHRDKEQGHGAGTDPPYLIFVDRRETGQCLQWPGQEDSGQESMV